MQKRIENVHLYLIAGNTLTFASTNQLSHRHYSLFRCMPGMHTPKIPFRYMIPVHAAIVG